MARHVPAGRFSELVVSCCDMADYGVGRRAGDAVQSGDLCKCLHSRQQGAVEAAVTAGSAGTRGELIRRGPGPSQRRERVPVSDLVGCGVSLKPVGCSLCSRSTT